MLIRKFSATYNSNKTFKGNQNNEIKSKFHQNIKLYF